MEFCDYKKKDAQIRSYNFKIGSTMITCNYTVILKVVLPKVCPTDLILVPCLISLACDTTEISIEK